MRANPWTFSIRPFEKLDPPTELFHAALTMEFIYLSQSDVEGACQYKASKEQIQTTMYLEKKHHYSLSKSINVAGVTDAPFHPRPDLLPEDYTPEQQADWQVEPQIVREVDNRYLREWLDAGYPYSKRMARREYENIKRDLQIELLKLQTWLKDNNERLVIIFEGRDAAGKGGTIKRFMEHLNPRGARVVALSKPTDIERGQWYFQRYIEHLPTAGEIVLFDRSWYNRAGVERVMGFCTETEYDRFLTQTVEIERNLREAGTMLVKFWLSVGKEEQERRFNKRANDPLKRWKLSPIDIESMQRFDAYTEAERAMFQHTATNENPWVVIKSDDKKRARLNAMRHVLNTIDYDGKDHETVGATDGLIVNIVEEFWER